jgi:hypothetical protein
VLSPAMLRQHAKGEATGLGPSPQEPRARARWMLAREGAIEFLAALSEWSEPALRRAAFALPRASAAGDATDLLTEAAARCLVPDE